MDGPVNVAHVAGSDGAHCARCSAGIGCYAELSDVTNELYERPWRSGERVLEVECPNGRTLFTDSATGFAVDCQP